MEATAFGDLRSNADGQSAGCVGCLFKIGATRAVDTCVGMDGSSTAVFLVERIAIRGIRVLVWSQLLGAIGALGQARNVFGELVQRGFASPLPA